MKARDPRGGLSRQVAAASKATPTVGGHPRAPCGAADATPRDPSSRGVLNSPLRDLLFRRARETGDQIAGVVIERFGKDVPFTAAAEVAKIIRQGIVRCGMPLLIGGVSVELVAEYRNEITARVRQRLDAVRLAHMMAESTGKQ